MAETEQAFAWIDVAVHDSQPVVRLDMSLPVAVRMVEALDLAIEGSEELDSEDLDLILNIQDGIRVRITSLIAAAQGFRLDVDND